MRMLSFAKRNTKEILRDPLNLFFGLGFPLVLLLLLTAIQARIPVSLFQLEHLTPGISVFGLSFMTLFSALIIAKDRSSSFLQRLYTSPLKSRDFILGYTLPMLPMALGQCILCYGAAMILGLAPGISIVYAVIGILPLAFLFVSLGLLFGSILTDKQVGGVCGALLTNLTAWLSGIWFELDLVGGAFRKIAYFLPFVHGVEMERAIIQGNYGEIFPHLWWILAYDVLIFSTATILFLRQMKNK